MKWTVLLIYLFWFGMLSLIFGLIPNSITSVNPANFDYNSINSSGFNENEIDTGSFFGGIVGITQSGFRFIGFIAFGITPSGWDCPAGFQTFLIFWNTTITLSFIAFVISIFYDG